MPGPARTFHLVTLGCPKNVVDSEKMAAALAGDGLEPTSLDEADLVVLNTCAFVEAAREESIETALALADAKRAGAALVLTGCMAERYGEELAEALPEVDAVVGFAGQAAIADPVLRSRPAGVTDLADLPRPAPSAPWAYLKVAEGCDRACAFCAIPSFRGKQRSRPATALVAEAESLVERGVRELVLVAQDLASYGHDLGRRGALPGLLGQLDRLVERGLVRQRLLYLYPSQVRDPLVATVLALGSVVAYFDLSLQHASRRLLRGMRRWGSGDRFLRMIDEIRRREPDAAFRSSFIVGYPGETEDDHDELLGFLESAELDWAGFFPFSREDGTPAAALDGAPGPEVVAERIGELSEVQERITRAGRDALVGAEVEVLVDRHVDSELAPNLASNPALCAVKVAKNGSGEQENGAAVGRTHREAPEIDGVVYLAGEPPPAGALVRARVTTALGPDLVAELGDAGP